MLTSIRLHNHTFSIRYFNRDFVLLYDEAANGLAGVGKAILDQEFTFVEEVIAAEKEIYLKFNEHYQEGNLAQLSAVAPKEKATTRKVKIPIYFDLGGDWEEIIRYTGLSKRAYIEKLIKLEFSIAMFGFMPGFVYMNGLSTELQVPRKATPSRHMSANSLAVGGPYLGIYSLPSPAGWQRVGVLPFSLLSWETLPPLLLEATDRISLEPISRKEFNAIQNQQLSFLEYNGLT